MEVVNDVNAIVGWRTPVGLIPDSAIARRQVDIADRKIRKRDDDYDDYDDSRPTQV